MTDFDNIQWVVQENLTNTNDLRTLKAACIKLGISFIGMDIIPFSTQLPDFDRSKKSIFYGSTTFNKLAFEDSELKAGIFFDPATFSIEQYLKEWGSEMLNYGSSVTTFEALIQSDYDPEKLLFIRPDDDGKSFAGEVIKFGDCVSWFENIQGMESSIIGSSKIVVGEPGRM